MFFYTKPESPPGLLRKGLSNLEMDLPCVQWQDHVSRIWTGLDPSAKERFTSLSEVDDVFKLAYDLVTPADLNFVQTISAQYQTEKNADEALKHRERGNSSFRSRDYTSAALHYSRGVCFAPRSSEQLSMCYANRSAALYHLHQDQDCLDDIDQALKNGYPSHLTHKLDDRRAQCLKRLSGLAHSRSFSKIHKESDGGEGPAPVALTKWISPQAAVEFNPRKGRHVVATERIAAGDVVMSERPYSCVLIPGRTGGQTEVDDGVFFGTEHRRCHRCLTETLRSLPCDGCSYSRYCSARCKRDAWEEHHRWECPLGAELMAMGVMSQLALRVTLKVGLKNIRLASETLRDQTTNMNSSPGHKSEPSPILYYGHSYLSVFCLLHHLSCHSAKVRFLSAVTVATLYLKLSRAGPPPASWELSRPSGDTDRSADGKEAQTGTTSLRPEQWLLGGAVLRHLLQLRCNSQAVTVLQDSGVSSSPVQSNQEIRIATAIFPTLSLLNHSCRPNTSLVFATGSGGGRSGIVENVTVCGDDARGVSVTIRAAKTVDPGQEILHCYGPHSSRMVTSERQRLLQDQYYFLCRCEACTEEGGVRDGRQSPDEGDAQQKPGFLCGSCRGPLRKTIEDGGGEFRCARPSCGRCVSSSAVSQRLRETRLALEKAVELMEKDRPDEALRLLGRPRDGRDLILAETHPLQGELADATARAYATIGDWKSAASHLERSASAVGSQYGEDSVEMGRQLFKLAQLHFNGGARRQALTVIPAARRLLRLHCGRHCSELQELRAMEDCLHGST